MVVEVLTMLKFWKSNPNFSSKPAPKTTLYSQKTLTPTVSDHHFTDDSDDDDDDSFFELELTSPSPHHHNHDDHDDDEVKVFKKPQSPMSVLRSASPKLFKNVMMMMMMMMNKNSRVEEFADTDSVSGSFYSPKRISTDSIDSDSSFTIKFKIEDGSIVPKLTRTRSNNSNTCISKSPKIESRNDGVSKSFSKNTVQKYLNNIIKPKTALKKSNNNGGCSPPLMKEREEKQSASRFKTKCKQLGKCKSASAVVGVSSPASFPARYDFPADGIEGAILHCKRSLTCSTIGYSSLSRCSSDPSYDKSIQVPEVCR